MSGRGGAGKGGGRSRDVEGRAWLGGCYGLNVCVSKSTSKPNPQRHTLRGLQRGCGQEGASLGKRLHPLWAPSPSPLQPGETGSSLHQTPNLPAPGSRTSQPPELREMNFCSHK